MATRPGLTWTEANAAAWQTGRTLLERAIRERLDFAWARPIVAAALQRH